MVTRSFGDKLMAAAGQPTLEVLEQQIDSDRKPRSAELAGWTLTARVEIERTTITTRNVVGVLVDLARLAGMVPAGIICEIMKDDGSMARVPDLVEFCRIHDMKMLTVADLIRYRMQHERYVHRVGEAMVETRHGELRLSPTKANSMAADRTWP